MRELRSAPGPRWALVENSPGFWLDKCARYRIPQGGLFDYATQAVYFCEPLGQLLGRQLHVVQPSSGFGPGWASFYSASGTQLFQRTGWSEKHKRQKIPTKFDGIFVGHLELMAMNQQITRKVGNAELNTTSEFNIAQVIHLRLGPKRSIHPVGLCSQLDPQATGQQIMQNHQMNCIEVEVLCSWLGERGNKNHWMFRPGRSVASHQWYLKTFGEEFPAGWLLVPVSTQSWWLLVLKLQPPYTPAWSPLWHKHFRSGTVRWPEVCQTWPSVPRAIRMVTSQGDAIYVINIAAMGTVVSHRWAKQALNFRSFGPDRVQCVNHWPLRCFGCARQNGCSRPEVLVDSKPPAASEGRGHDFNGLDGSVQRYW